MNEFEKWINKNAAMYRGNNASDCMREAYKAGMLAAAEIVDCNSTESPFASEWREACELASFEIRKAADEIGGE